MAMNAEESQQMGRIEAKVDMLLAREDKCDDRITSLETFVTRLKGAFALLSLAGSILALVLFSGCAHSHTRTYYQDGALRCDSATTVVGTGEVTVLVESAECPDTIYESEDTGLSRNGKDAIGKVAEGVAAGMMKGMVP